jgi:hypothetical protein
MANDCSFNISVPHNKPIDKPQMLPWYHGLGSCQELDLSKFVVKQLKDAGSKLNTKGSVKGCVIVLVVSSLYSPYTFAAYFFLGQQLNIVLSTQISISFLWVAS